MPTAYHVALTLQRFIPRRMLALIANRVMALKDDKRRFSVDQSGNWVNSQPEGSFVGPDLHTAYFHQIRATVESHWFHEYTPGENDVIIDVGAGIGEDAVILSNMVGMRGRILAIEAHPGTFACLESTVKRSKLCNVETHLLAITEADGIVTISDDAHHLGNSIVAADKGFDVTARSLDNFIEQNDLMSIDLLKINIEGAERGAMIGLERHAGKVRNAAISCHDFIADQGGGDHYRTKAAVHKRLIELGFTVTERCDADTPWQADVLFARRP